MGHEADSIDISGGGGGCSSPQAISPKPTVANIAYDKHKLTQFDVGGGHEMDEDALSQIPKKLQALVDRGQISGVVTLVARNGKIASIDVVGWRYMAKKNHRRPRMFFGSLR